MANEFFNKPQLGQAQLSNAQQSNLSDEDIKARRSAEFAARNIESLSGLGKRIASNMSGAYIKNIDAKNRLASETKREPFMKYVQGEMSRTENIESYSDEALEDKYAEYTENYLKQHADKPYESQLKKDLALMSPSMLTNMRKNRDAVHTQIVTDSSSQGASNAAKMFSEGLIDREQYYGRLGEIAYDATFALQVPSSSNVPLSEQGRENYMTKVTNPQALEAMVKGIMIQTGAPNNSVIANDMASPEFRKAFNISETDEEYNKLLSVVQKKGARADKINYDSGLDSLKETMYTKTNQGFSVNVDTEVEKFKASGKQLTAQDEHKLRKTFKDENSLITTTDAYVSNLSKSKGAFDMTVGMTKKDREDVYDRGFTSTLGLTGEEISISSIDAQLSDKTGFSAFSDYLSVGGGIPEKVGRMFDIPAGKDNVNSPKWLIANATIQSMSAAAQGSGRSITTILGADRVGKIRAMANIQSNPILDEQQKSEQQLSILDDYSKINSRGYMKPMQGSTVDREALIVGANEAEWTTDNLEGSRQNLELLEHYAYQNERTGMNGKDATELAIEQFNDGHSQHENPDGTEIAIPIEHKNLNPTGLKMFARGNADIASRIAKQNAVLFSDYRINRQIGMKKAPDFNVSKDYILTYDGQVVTGGRFKYEDYSEYINILDPKLQRQVNKNLNKSKRETIEEASEKRSRRVKAKGHGETIQFSQGQFDFEFNN